MRPGMCCKRQPHRLLEKPITPHAVTIGWGRNGEFRTKLAFTRQSPKACFLSEADIRVPGGIKPPLMTKMGPGPEARVSINEVGELL